ncbi:MAG TPA: GTP-binding protein, partial [Pyrinomonadaceae bacterium]|nr:GTP-binding protein [Pyrinomonadaceae bacterium]
MKVYPTEAIRNLAVIGHGDAGKTQLVSSLLYVAGATPRWGKVDEGTTVTDHEDDSIARKITLNTALAHLEHRDTKLNFIDTPGYAAFVSHARPALRVADCAIVVVDGVKGVEVQTEKTWAYANEFLVPRVMVITKLDKEHADFGAALQTAQNTFSRAIIPFTLPIGKEKDFRGVVDVVHMKAYELGADGQAKEIDIPSEGRDVVDKTRERLVELVAESNDQLMEKYFEQGTLDEEDILPNINNAIAQSKLCPVFAVSSLTQVGLRALLNALVDYAPDPAHHEAEWGHPVDAAPDAERIGRKYSDSEPFSAYCFRTIADPFAGRINVFKIISGHLHTDANAFNSTRGVMERLGALHVTQGKQLDKVSDAHAGDIIACVKLKETQTGDTLCD